MDRWLRIALMCLLAVALPMRGWAAMTMAQCGPSHQQMAIQTTASHHETRHAEASADDVYETHSEHVLESSSSTASVMSHVVNSSSDDAHSVHKASQFKCSVCASCCIGAGLPSAIQTVQAVDTPHSIWPAMTPATGFFLTAGLDRPPRFRRT